VGKAVKINEEDINWGERSLRMKKIVIVFIFLLMFSKLFAYDPLVTNIKQSQKACFLCGRTPEDYNQIADGIISEYEKAIRNYEIQLADEKRIFRDEYFSLLREFSSVSSINLEFTIGTVENDLETFRKIMPKIDKLIKAAKELDCYSKNTKLSTVLSNIEQYEWREIKNGIMRIEGAKHKKELLEQVRGDMFQHNYIQKDIRIRTLIVRGLPTTNYSQKTRFKMQIKNHINEAKSLVEKIELDPSLYHSLSNEFYKYVESESSRLNDMEKEITKAKLLELLFGGMRGHYTIYICPVCKELLEQVAQDIWVSRE